MIHVSYKWDKENVSNGQNTETNISKSSEVEEEVDAGSSSSSSASSSLVYKIEL